MESLFSTFNIRSYIDTIRLNHAAIFMFIWLLTNDYVWLSYLCGLFTIIFSIYVYSTSSNSGNLFIRVAEELLLYYIIAHIVVSYSIPMINMIIALWLPICYFGVTIIIMKQLTTFISEKYKGLSTTVLVKSINNGDLCETAQKSSIIMDIYPENIEKKSEEIINKSSHDSIIKSSDNNILQQSSQSSNENPQSFDDSIEQTSDENFRQDDSAENQAQKDSNKQDSTIETTTKENDIF